MNSKALKILTFCLGFSLLAGFSTSCKTKEKKEISKTDEKTEETSETPLNRLGALSGAGEKKGAVEEAASGMQEALPLDPSVRTGQLPNGMKYYIRKNAKPENRLELRLAVNAGSMQEEDNQRGLAHFVEHMAFNGTKNFEKDALVNFLELTGVRFGADLNAYTSFDETVYMLQLPTDRKGLIDTGLLVMSDWATGVTFDDEEIDKERGVIESEWRTRLGSGERMRQVYWPKLFYNSHYANRLPIGTMDVINNAPYERLRTFYKDWYRPNLMALVVVGDLDPDDMEKRIKAAFSPLKNPEKPREKKLFEIPEHKDTKIAIARDPEEATVGLQVIYKHPPVAMKTLNDYYTDLSHDLYNAMLNERFSELSQQKDAPFNSAAAQYTSFVRSGSMYMAFASPKEGKLSPSLESLLTEHARLKQHGFLDTELERQKNAMLKRMEKRYNERDKVTSASLSMGCVQHFLDDQPMMGTEKERELLKEFLPKITLADVNKLAEKWLTDENRVVIVTAPEDAELPNEAELLNIFEKTKNIETEPFKDKFLDQPLIAKMPEAGKIVKEETLTDNELNVTTLTLSNGVRVLLKPTDYQDDQILLNAYSPGGHSLYSDADFMSASFAAGIVDQSGVGAFDLISLSKKLSANNVSITPYIGELYEGFSQGSSTVEDFEVLLQLVYLYATAPRKDADAFENRMNEVREQLKAAAANPQQYFFDQYGRETSLNHPRRKSLYSEEELAKVNLDRALQIYKERFSDCSDFTFVLVGNIDLEKHKPLIEKYLGALPAKKRVENWKDVGVQLPPKPIVKSFTKGLAPQSLVLINYAQRKKWDADEALQYQAALKVLGIMVRENLREDKGGVYSPFVGGGFQRQPHDESSFITFFQCAPKDVQTLSEAVKDEIRSLQKDGPSEDNLKKVKETLRRERETSLKQNNFWLSVLTSYGQINRSLTDLADFEQRVDALTKEQIQAITKSFVPVDKLNVLSLMPEEKKEGGKP